MRLLVYHERVKAFLKQIGMEPRKMGSIPAKADSQAQQEFLQEKLEPRLEQAKAGKRAVFFIDASHFVLMAYFGIV